MLKSPILGIQSWWLAIAFGMSVLVAQDEGPGARRVNATGKVIDSVTSRPMRNLRLHMECSTKDGPGGSYRAVTDEQGTFSFVGVPDNVCVVSIENHRLSMEYSGHFNGTEKVHPWIIRLIPGVVISGTVLDEKGSPLRSARVFLGGSSLEMGERSQAFTRQTDTDQQGHFHFDIAQENNRDMGIEDRYRLCSEYAPSGTELRIVYPLICFPGVSDRDKAEWIELHPGQSRDITFPLRPVPAGTISGRVAGAHRITQLSVFHTDRRDFMNMGSVGDPWVKPKTSTFELAGMVPGKYRVSAESRSDATRLTCAADVDVRSGEVTSVALSLTPEAVLRGRVHADDSTTLKRENRRLTLHGRDGGDSVDAPIPEDGRFRVPVQKLESYRLSFDILPPWHVASATSGGHDVLAEGIHVGSDDQLEPVDVVLSRSVGTIEVSLTAQEGASEGSILLLHPVGSRVENAGHLMDGTAYIHSLPANFKWSHVPPGIYWVLAVSNIRVPYLEMKFLNQHREFIREVVVVAGGTSRAQLKLLDLN